MANSFYGLSRYTLESFTDVAGRSSPRSVSVCHFPFASSNSMTASGPGTLCSAAAVRAAFSAAACVG